MESVLAVGLLTSGTACLFCTIMAIAQSVRGRYEDYQSVGRLGAYKRLLERK